MTVDLLLGIDTARIERHEDLGFGPERGVYYAGTPWLSILHLRRVLARSAISSDDVFVDLGSGKGRVLLVAAKYPFRRVVGVELSERLHRASQANVDRKRAAMACGEVELVNCDALEYAVPDDATVFYMYNPFKGHVFDTVIDRIRRSVEEKPRSVTLVYTNPVMHDSMEAHGFAMTEDLGQTRVYTNRPDRPL